MLQPSKNGPTQVRHALAQIAPILYQSEASSVSRQGTSVLKGNPPKCLDGGRIGPTNPSTIRCQSNINPLPILCQSVTNPLSIRCQSNVNPTSLRCQSMPILDQSPNPRPIHQFIANPLDPMPHRPYTDQPNTPSSHLSEPFIKTGLTQDWYALAKITPIYCQSEASSASKQGTSVLEGSLPKCLDGGRFGRPPTRFNQPIDAI